MNVRGITFIRFRADKVSRQKCNRKNFMFRSKALSFAAVALSLTTLATPAHAESFDREASRFTSGTGTIIYLTTGVALPLLLDGENGKNHSLRALDSLGTSILLCEGLKEVTQVKRPDSDARDSFPSCHATAAFAVASLQSHYHPKSAIY